MPEIDKAKHFKSLHVAGNPLVVYNIWDAGSAMCLAQQGATAIATGSLSVGASQGFADGEVVPLQRALETAQQIAQSVDIPVSLDFEGGYARDPETLKANIKAVIATGVIGINLEDQIVKGTGLYALTEQVARLKAVRHAAEQQGMPLFFKARTDIFLKTQPAQHHEALVDQALERAAAFTEAGADGFFIPGLTDPALIAKICKNTSLPVNVLMRGGLETIAQVADLGVARASYEPGPYLAALQDLAIRFENLPS